LTSRGTARRIPVLLILGAIILGCSWFPPEPELQASAYYLVPDTSANPQHEKAEVLRLPQQQALSGSPENLPADALAISPDLPCGSMPARLTRLFNLPLPINQASQESLIPLPGIGPKLAERIIVFRETHGPIAGPEDFIRVKGIGPKLTARLTPLLCFTIAED
jgi:competence ComEA-like helix-hairpin-helix protein